MSPQPPHPQPPPSPAPGSPPPSPQPPPSPAPAPEPAAINGAESEPSSTASARASRTVSSPLVGDPGPDFDPDTPGAEPPPAPEPEPVAGLPEPEWDEESIRRWLLVQGELTHSVIGLAENEWRHTEADLKSIAGPLSRILNRYDTTRAVAAYNDPLSVVFGTSMYAIRSINERRVIVAELRAAKEAAPVETPAPGAPPAAGPQPNAADLDWEIRT
jgi:hypothetical protein